MNFYFQGWKSDLRLDGKTVIITGANIGIGKETALDMAKRGARVILACRDLGKAETAAGEIKATSGNDNVVVEQLDLASLESVRQFAKRVNASEPFVNILVNNAGELSGIFCSKTTLRKTTFQSRNCRGRPKADNRRFRNELRRQSRGTLSSHESVA